MLIPGDCLLQKRCLLFGADVLQVCEDKRRFLCSKCGWHTGMMRKQGIYRLKKMQAALLAWHGHLGTVSK